MKRTLFQLISAYDRFDTAWSIHPISDNGKAPLRSTSFCEGNKVTASVLYARIAITIIANSIGMARFGVAIGGQARGKAVVNLISSIEKADETLVKSAILMSLL